MRPRWLRKRDNGWHPHPPRRSCPPHLFLDIRTQKGTDDDGNQVIYHHQKCDTCGKRNLDIEYVTRNGKDKR